MRFCRIKIYDKNRLKDSPMRVAFATKDLININDHFGWAKQFAIYEVSKNGFQLSEVVKTTEDIAEEDDKINSKIDAIKNVAIMYCEAIGPTAAAKVIRSRIHPIKVTEPTTINDMMENLVKMLNTNPPPWIKRIIANEEGASNE
jgi:nitrogen fixation protein NifX